MSKFRELIKEQHKIGCFDYGNMEEAAQDALCQAFMDRRNYSHFLGEYFQFKNGTREGGLLKDSINVITPEDFQEDMLHSFNAEMRHIGVGKSPFFKLFYWPELPFHPEQEHINFDNEHCRT